MNKTSSIVSFGLPAVGRRQGLFQGWLAVLIFGLSLWCDGALAVATGKLTSLTVANLSPAFAPSVTAYTIPKTTACSVKVTAKAAGADSNTQFYIANTLVSGGSGTVNAWYCSGSGVIDIYIYQNWAQKGHYTITPVQQAAAPPPPAAVSGKLTNLVVANLSPAIDPAVKQ
jgi:hypothetical protein